MGERYLLAIDQGTTSSRAIIFNRDGREVYSAQREFAQHYPKAGWVEHDANEIWAGVLACAREVLDQAGEAKDIAAIGITNQRETVVMWDRSTGQPIHRAIVWQDRRTSDFCGSLVKDGHEAIIQDKTGLLIDPYFSCSKVKWILDHVDGARQKAAKGDLAFGTIDSFLLWKLTGGKVHATDATNAARTGLFNIRTQAWDQELLKLYDVPESILPEVKDNVAAFGETAADLLGAPIMVGGMAGDQHAAMIGQCCFEEGMIKSTYGTGCFALMNIGPEFKVSQNRLLTTPAYRFDGKVTYAVEGSIFMAGAIVQWLRDSLNIIGTAQESEALAGSINDNGGVYMIPAFTGLGAPHWKPEARAAIMGLTRGVGKAEVARAALEAQGYQTRDLMAAMENDSGIKAAALRVDGRLVANRFVCQFLADILQVDIHVPNSLETTALGAAYLAGLQAGFYDGLDDLSLQWQQKRSYKPVMESAEADRLYSEWSGYLSKIAN
jgi:glycerol kinase